MENEFLAARFGHQPQVPNYGRGNYPGQDAPLDMTSGIATSFKDLMNMRSKDPPILKVCDPMLKSSGPSKHHVFTIRGSDN